MLEFKYSYSSSLLLLYICLYMFVCCFFFTFAVDFILRMKMNIIIWCSVRMWRYAGCWNGLQDLTNSDLYARSYPLRTCADLCPASIGLNTSVCHQRQVGMVTGNGYWLPDNCIDRFCTCYTDYWLFELLTRSSATAEKQRVSCACLPTST